MYIPASFAITDPAKIAQVISAHSFAMMISRDGASLFASHLPFLHYPEQGAKGKLTRHMARANHHWKLFHPEEETLVIFNGPHTYISPTWYVTQNTVPTWNYVTVHVHGIPKILETEAELKSILDQTVQKHESTQPQPWSPNLPPDMEAKLHKALVGFEIEITRIEAKFKLGQNRSKEDQAKMMKTLLESGDDESIRLARFMETELNP